MKMKTQDGNVFVTLSRRNLRTLLAKLDRPDSYKTIYVTTDAGFLTVRAEDDADHYVDREPGEVLDAPVAP